MIKKAANIFIYIVLVVIWYWFFYTINLSFVDLSFKVNYILLIEISFFIGLILFIFRKSKLNIYSHIIAFLFSLILMIGNAIKATESIGILIELSNITGKLLMLVEYYLLFIALFKFTRYLLSFLLDSKTINNKYILKILDFYKKHPILISFILIFLAWLAYIIAFYPAIIYHDSKNQLLQYLNIETKYIKFTHLRDPNVLMTAHHSVLHTHLIGWCFSLGRMLLNDNFGLFIHSFLQTVLVILVLSYSIKIAFKYNVKPLFIILLLLLYMFAPMFPFYSMTIGKDTTYFIFYALLVLFLFDYISSPDYKLTKKNIISLFLISLLLCLMRNNGIYCLIAFIPLIIVSKKKKVLLIILVFTIFSVGVINKVLFPSMGISDGSIREMLSVPFQQTARYNSLHYMDVPVAEKQIINRVLDYKSIIHNYKPGLSDDVKKTYNIDATYEDLVNYFKVWFIQGTREPLVYIDATLNNTYGFYYPLISKWYIYYDYINLSKYNIEYYYNDLTKLKGMLKENSDFFHDAPFIGLTSNVGFSFWWLMLLASYIMEKKRYRYLIVLIPLFITFISCVLGPANIHFRYALPNIFILPVLTLLIMFRLKKDK